MRTISETETIIKKILPYLERLGYSIEKDISFEDPTLIEASNRQGFIDILIHCQKKKPLFLIEAKRDGVRLIEKHRHQALEYAKSVGCLFCVVTNGKNFEIINAHTGKIILLNGKDNKIPRRIDLTEVITQLKNNPDCNNLILKNDVKIPYREGLSLSKMNQLIQTCHNTIRRIEKNEETAFADFSKFLFLKLLEEKWDRNDEPFPYSYTFYELAETKDDKADRVKDAVISMLKKISSMSDYGEVINCDISLKKDITYLKIVKILSDVSFSDCDLDSKGAAFEYFVRATLKGKKLGQYFTPRPLVKLMIELSGSEKIVTSLLYGGSYKVLDPACGTGGFLVVAMNQAIQKVQLEYKEGNISKDVYVDILRKIKGEVFFGVDANEGVASSAKMNMIIAGDGHSNIRCMDSLKIDKFIPPYYRNGEKIEDGLADIILSNPPFGTVEGESLGDDIANYKIKSTKGQHLFLQKMIHSVKASGRIVTVIDEGVLNTESYHELRKYILKCCVVEMIISLPEETFKPNKINVKSSVLVLRKRENADENLIEGYEIRLVRLKTLGYDGSGEEVKDFDERKMINDILELTRENNASGKLYKADTFDYFKIDVQEIIADRTCRLDYRYWNPDVFHVCGEKYTKTIADINTIVTSRGKSPKASDYVSKKDGYALVAKAGTNISKTGLFICEGDYLDESTFLDGREKYFLLQDGDILIASTGDGTLGKCCVYRKIKNEDNKEIPVIADGHITIIRVNQKEIYPEFICDYLRIGMGAQQIDRLYTGSTGLIELTPIDVDTIKVPGDIPIKKQKELSKKLRNNEQHIAEKINLMIKERENVIKEFNSQF